MKPVQTIMIMSFISAVAVAQQQKGFYQGGVTFCEADCGAAGLEEQSKVIEMVKAQCAPLVVAQISDWEVKVHGFGRLSVGALFSCIAD